MQKLSKRNTYTPTDTPLVCSNCGSTLNSSEGRSSVLNLKTSDNISEEALTAAWDRLDRCSLSYMSHKKFIFKFNRKLVYDPSLK